MKTIFSLSKLKGYLCLLYYNYISDVIKCENKELVKKNLPIE